MKQVISWMMRLLPILMNFITGGIAFVIAQRLSAGGYSGLLVTIPALSSGVATPLFCYWIGRIVSQKNAPNLIFFSALAKILAAVFLLCFKEYFWYILVELLLALASGCYNVPVQLMLKRVELRHTGGIMRASCTYVLMTGIGAALGTWVCAKYTLEVCLYGCLLCGLLLTVLPFVADRVLPQVNVMAEKAAPDISAYHDKPNLMLSCWIAGAALSMTVCLTRLGAPYHAHAIGFPKEVSATSLTLFSIIGGITALLLMNSRKWMYNVWAVFAMIFALPLSAAAYGLSGTLLPAWHWLFYAGGILLGIGYGCILCYCAFHAMIHVGRDGRYAAITETVIGAAAFLGASFQSSATQTCSYPPFVILLFCTATLSVVSVISVYRSRARRYQGLDL